MVNHFCNTLFLKPSTPRVPVQIHVADQHEIHSWNSFVGKLSRQSNPEELHALILAVARDLNEGNDVTERVATVPATCNRMHIHKQ